MESLNGKIVCGIDPSITSTGIALVEVISIEEEKFRVLEFVSLVNKRKLRGINRWQKKEHSRELFEFFFSKDRMKIISFCVFENYSYGSVGYLADAGEIGGLYKHHLWDNNVPFDVIAPSTVKRLVGKSGRASKEEVADGLKAFVINQEIFEKITDTDQSDAVAVAISYCLLLKEDEKKKNESSKS